MDRSYKGELECINVFTNDTCIPQSQANSLEDKNSTSGMILQRLIKLSDFSLLYFVGNNPSFNHSFEDIGEFNIFIYIIYFQANIL